MKTRALFLLLATPVLAFAGNFRLSIGNSEFTSYTKFGFIAQTTVGFDKAFDKVMDKLPGNRINYIYSTDAQGKRMYENYCPMPSPALSIPVQIHVLDTGAFELGLDDPDNTLASLLVTLTDIETGEVISLTPGSSSTLEFHARDNDKTKKFQLNIFPQPVIISSPVSCAESKDGSIHLWVYDKESWTAQVSGSGKSLPIIQENMNWKTDFNNLARGVYEVKIIKNKIPVYQQYIAVQAPVRVKAAFAVIADTVQVGQRILTENLSLNSSHWYWQFGDGVSSNYYAPSHAYKSTGEFAVTLTSADYAGCISTTTKKVVVTEPLVVQ